MTIGIQMTRADNDRKLRWWYLAVSSLVHEGGLYVAQMGDAIHDDTWLGTIYSQTPEPQNNALSEAQQARAAVNQIDKLTRVISGQLAMPDPDDLLYWARKAAGF